MIQCLLKPYKVHCALALEILILVENIINILKREFTHHINDGLKYIVNRAGLAQKSPSGENAKGPYFRATVLNEAH